MVKRTHIYQPPAGGAREVPGPIMEDARRAAGITNRDEIAEAVGVSTRTVMRWENEDATRLYAFALFGLLVARGNLYAAGILQKVLPPQAVAR